MNRDLIELRKLEVRVKGSWFEGGIVKQHRISLIGNPEKHRLPFHSLCQL
jgi:hypothetical protein